MGRLHPRARLSLHRRGRGADRPPGRVRPSLDARLQRSGLSDRGTAGADGRLSHERTHEDRYGLPLSTASSEAAAAYRDGVDLMLSAWTGRGGGVRARDRGRSRFRAGAYRPRPHPFVLPAGRGGAEGSGDGARARRAGTAPSARRAMSRRWRSPSRASCRRRWSSALKHLESWPRDAVVLSLPLGAFGLFAFSGMADHDQARQDLCERYAPHYGEDWWFLSNYGWSMTENGEVAKGRAMTERAFDAAPQQRLCRACAAACDVRGRLGRRRRRAGRRNGSAATTAPASCTAISAGIRRSARSKSAMRQGAGDLCGRAAALASARRRR